MPTVSDLRQQFFTDNTGLTGKTLSDMEFHYYSNRSGLTPLEKFSLADHKRAFLESKTGLSGHTLRFLEKKYFEQQGGAVGPYSDMALAFYDFDPFRLAGLELALDADRVAGDSIIFRDEFDHAPVGATLGPGWTNYGTGTWGITDNKAILTNLAAGYTGIDVGLVDQDIEALVYPPTAVSNAGIAARISSATNLIWLDIDEQGRTRVYKYVGAPIMLQDRVQSAVAGEPTLLRLVVKGTSIRAYVNGALVYSDSTAASDVPISTQVGLRHNLASTAAVEYVRVRPAAYSEGDSVAQWIDLSGKGRHVTQSDPTKQPKYRSVNKNLLSYGFATATTPTSLVFVAGSGTVTSDTVIKRNAPASLKITTTSSGSIFLNNYDRVPVKPTERLYVKGAMIGPTGRTYQLYIEWFNEASAPIGQDVTGPLALTTDTWVDYISKSFVPPVNAVYACVYLALYSVVAGDVFSLTEISASTEVLTAWVPPVTLPNSKPTVQFDGIDDFLSNGQALDNTLSNPVGFTAYLVVTSQAIAGANQTLLGKETTFKQSTTASGQYTTLFGTGLGWLTNGIRNTGVNVTKTAQILSAWINNATYRLNNAVDGVNFTEVTASGPASTNPSTAATTPFGLGGYMSASVPGVLREPANVTITAVLIFSAVHDDATRKRVEKWLGNKYGIAVA